MYGIFMNKNGILVSYGTTVYIKEVIKSILIWSDLTGKEPLKNIIWINSTKY